MTHEEAINVVKSNWPSSSYTRLREALETLVPELKESEDERIRKDIISFVEQAIDAGYGIIDKERKEKWLAWLEKQSKQKPTWSEEDEKMLGKCIDAASGYYSPEDKQSIKDWLRTLKERYTWKPGKEQIDILFKYAEQNNYDGSVLTSLYNDLKKL